MCTLFAHLSYGNIVELTDFSNNIHIQKILKPVTLTVYTLPNYVISYTLNYAVIYFSFILFFYAAWNCDFVYSQHFVKICIYYFIKIVYFNWDFN